MIRVVAENRNLTIYGPFPIEFLKVLSRTSGRKIWTQSKQVRVEGSAWNLKILKESGFDLSFEDTTDDIKEIENIKNLFAVAEPIPQNYHPKLPLKEHQLEGLRLSVSRHAFAWFLEMGLGKTAMAIANFCILWLQKKIEAVLVLSPKGVHKQWVAEEIPKHIDPTIPLNMTLWSAGSAYESGELKVSGALNIFSMNIDSVNTNDGDFAIRQFFSLFGAKFDMKYSKKGDRSFVVDKKAKVMMIIDESHQIGNYSSKRTQETIEFGKLTEYRRILTGTPIATSLLNMWCQFMFLDTRIIGIDYITTFKSRFCETGGHTGYEVIGSKNVEEFYAIIAPHCFRKTKAECLDLPDKIYAQRTYMLGNETRWHYENIKQAFMTELKSGNIVAPKNALASLVRLQQVCSGFLPDEDENELASKRVYEIFSYERAEIALDMVKQIEGQVIIWARFIPDIKCIRHKFQKDFGKEIAIMDEVNTFKAGKKKILLSNQAKGIGGNLQESGCTNMIYYNNSFNLIHRLQSEDRVHRMGMRGALTIWDITADRTVDKTIADNLKAKKDLAQFVLDDIRALIET
jgi:SNF2 family DNA or RNA helicase